MAFLAPLALSFAPSIIDAFSGIFTDEEEEDYDEYYYDEYDDYDSDDGWSWW